MLISSSQTCFWDKRHPKNAENSFSKKKCPKNQILVISFSMSLLQMTTCETIHMIARRLFFSIGPGPMIVVAATAAPNRPCECRGRSGQPPLFRGLSSCRHDVRSLQRTTKINCSSIVQSAVFFTHIDLLYL
jgi:hypothetical protein